MRPELLTRIDSLLPAGGDTPELARYAQMLRDYPQRGGKGIRSELLLGTARAYGVQPESPEWQRALWLAAALELFQNWVLIHDDIEDDSEERRGRPALHRLHGVPLAINAGDALHVYMWMAVRRSGVDRALDEFMQMVLKTAEGQHLDLAWVESREWNLTEADYLRMVRLKTAYYTVIYPLRLGALAAGREPAPQFEAAGLALGTAFQIRDDVLNLIGDPAKYGKEIGGDLLEGKRTLIGSEARGIIEARAIGPLELEIRTERPDPVLPRRLAAIMMIEPKALTDMGMDAVRAQHHGSTRPRRRKRIHRNTGAPRMAVTMPIGNSAGAMMTRLTTSAMSSSDAPKSAALINSGS